MIGTAASGRLSDRFGRRPMLLLSLCGSLVGFLFQAGANTLWLFIAARFVAGVFGGSVPVADSFIAIVIPLKDRSRYYAMLGSVITVAFMTGPGIGAGLSEFGLKVPMYMAAALAAFGLVTAIFKFEDVKKDALLGGPQNSAELAAAAAQMDSSAYHCAKYLLWLISCTNMIGFAAYLYFFGPLMLVRFEWEALEFGFASMGVSIFSVIVQLTLYGRAIARFGKHMTLIIGLILSAIGLLVLSFAAGPTFIHARAIPFTIVGLMLMAIGNSCAVPTTTTLLTRYSPSNTIGATLGTSKSLQGFARAVGPLVYGAVFDINIDFPFYIASGCAAVAAMAAIVLFCMNKKLPEHQTIRTDEGPVSMSAQESEQSQLEEYLLDSNTSEMKVEELRDLVKSLRKAVQSQADHYFGDTDMIAMMPHVTHGEVGTPANSAATVGLRFRGESAGAQQIGTIDADQQRRLSNDGAQPQSCPSSNNISSV